MPCPECGQGPDRCPGEAWRGWLESAMDYGIRHGVGLAALHMDLSHPEWRHYMRELISAP